MITGGGLFVVNKSYVIMVFRSRQHALNYIDIMKENNIKGTLIPTPKELSLGCGFSIKFENGFLYDVRELNQRYESHSNGMYSIIIKNNAMKYVKIS